MNNENKKLNITEAVNTLSTLTELDLENDFNLSHEPQGAKIIQWLDKCHIGNTEEIIKETFRVILNHLTTFYQKEYRYNYDPEALEEIKMIMVLVGDAAKKLDKYSTLFQTTHLHSITDLKEYKKLQAFYLKHVAHKIEEGVLGKWLEGLTNKVQDIYSLGSEIKRRTTKKNQTKHIFIDLESVKKDTEYELFLIRKEDGSRFFNPRLLRSIKLISEFGNYFGIEKENDSFLDIKTTQNKFSQNAAMTIIHLAHQSINHFYLEEYSSPDKRAAAPLRKALMALILSANPHNLNTFHINNDQYTKNCHDYFMDFQMFLRLCLNSRDYQNAVTYPNEKHTRLVKAVVDAVQEICRIIYTELKCYLLMIHPIHDMIHKAIQKEMTEKNSREKPTNMISFQLNRNHQFILKLLKQHPNGPLNRILNEIHISGHYAFDPLIQNNLPTRLFTFYVQETKINFARWPSPTYQESINQVELTEEFKAFLHKSVKNKDFKKNLVFNLQDRTHWKENCRSETIEDLTKSEIFKEAINVVTLAKDTEFYHQMGSYQEENHANVFIQQFKFQFIDELGGFFFPEGIRKLILTDFIDDALNAVLRIFFSGKNVLNSEQRLDFIEIFYQFLQLKIIDLINPDNVAFVCKDAIDTSSTTGTELFLFLKIITQETFSEYEREYCDVMLYGPSLILRERAIQPERFDRMINVLRTIESTKQQMGHANFIKVIQAAFGDLYDLPILEGRVIPEIHKTEAIE